MRGSDEFCEIIPGLMLGSVNDVAQMVSKHADVLVPLAFLDGRIWETGFRGEILYYPVQDMGVLPDDVLGKLTDTVCDLLEEGKRVGIFCGAGHGRTGYVAACILAKHGIKDPIGYLRRNYSAKAIETDKQANAVFSYMRNLRAEEVRSGALGDKFFEYQPYHGRGRYIYLSFSEWDVDIAPETVRVLNELGFNVCYDKDVLEGKLWSRKRSDMIEGCSLFITVSTPCEWTSHIRTAGHEFAELLDKPVMFIEMDEEYMKYYRDSDSDSVAGRPEDPDFAADCLAAIEKRGLMPHEEDDPGAKRFKGQYDLCLVYCKDYGDNKRSYNYDLRRYCNLRTREAWDSRHRELDRPSDEDLYRSIGWKCVQFDICDKSKKLDYYASPEDRAFMKRLTELGGKPVPEIYAEYKAIQKRIDDYWRDYPYMDEFEYVDSKFDD